MVTIEKCPCTETCKKRSAECRKTCEAFRLYDEDRMKDYKKRHADAEAKVAANPENTKARKAIRRAAWRRKQRGRG